MFIGRENEFVLMNLLIKFGMIVKNVKEKIAVIYLKRKKDHRNNLWSYQLYEV